MSMCSLFGCVGRLLVCADPVSQAELMSILSEQDSNEQRVATSKCNLCSERLIPDREALCRDGQGTISPA